LKSIDESIPEYDLVEVNPEPTENINGGAMRPFTPYFNIPVMTKEELEAARSFRCSKRELNHLRMALNCYVGTKNYFNFTIGKTFKDKSSYRYIMKFDVCTVFIYSIYCNKNQSRSTQIVHYLIYDAYCTVQYILYFFC